MSTNWVCLEDRTGIVRVSVRIIPWETLSDEAPEEDSLPSIWPLAWPPNDTDLIGGRVAMPTSLPRMPVRQDWQDRDKVVQNIQVF